MKKKKDIWLRHAQRVGQQVVRLAGSGDDVVELFEPEIEQSPDDRQVYGKVTLRYENGMDVVAWLQGNWCNESSAHRGWRARRWWALCRLDILQWELKGEDRQGSPRQNTIVTKSGFKRLLGKPSHIHFGYEDFDSVDWPKDLAVANS